jgi:hypothetical protein
LNETYGMSSRAFRTGKVLSFGSPFRTQLIWLSISSVLLVAWSFVIGILNGLVFYTRWVYFNDEAPNESDTARSWLDSEDLRNSWLQGRDALIFFWFVTIIVMTYSVVKVSARWREKWNGKWAIGGWFIPFGNLIIPFLVMHESERIIRHSLRDENSQVLTLSKRLDTSGFWFFGNLVVLFVLGFSAALTPVADDYNYELDTLCILSGILGSVLLLANVALTFIYFARQNLFVDHFIRFAKSAPTQDKSGMRVPFEPPSQSNSATHDAGTISEQIRHLGKLRDDGLITSVEFEQKKSELLGRI